MATCDFCAAWVAVSHVQHQERLRRIREDPAHMVAPCPQCGRTDWVVQPPDVPPDDDPPPPQTWWEWLKDIFTPLK